VSDGGGVWGNGWESPTQSPKPSGPRPDGGRARLGDLLESAIALVRRGGRLLVTGAIAVAFVTVALEVVVIWLLVRPMEVDLGEAPPPVRDLLDLTWRFIGMGATALATSWLVWVTAGGVAAAVQAEPDGPSDRDAVRRRLRRGWRSLLAMVVLAWTAAVALVVAAVGPAAVATRWGAAATVVALLLGLLSAVAAALVLIPRLALGGVAVIAESVGAPAGLRRAWRVSGGHYVRVVAVLALNVIVTHSVAAVLAAPLGVLEVQGDVSQVVIDAPLLIAGGAVGALAVIVTAPFTASLLAVCYADLRRDDRRSDPLAPGQ
jgi:hypothetical protein